MVELVLMRDVFHCTPVELAEQPMRSIAQVLACLAAEQMVREAEERRER